MSADTAIFYRDVAANRHVWTVKEERGFPAPRNSTGVRAQPFWSSLSRVERIIRTAPAYSAFQPYEITWDQFRDHWIPLLTRDGMKVGVNWSGKRVAGFDLDPAFVQRWIEYEITKLEGSAA